MPTPHPISAERPSPDPAIGRGERLALACAAALIVLLLAGRLWWLPVHALLNPDEGWNAGQAMRALGRGALYPSPDALVANNYPPLSFYMIGALTRLFGDAIVTGRIVALAAQIAAGGAIGTIVARLARGKRAVAVAALLFGGFGVTLLRPYLAMDDPQWLGHAVMCWALVLLVPRRADAAPSSRSIVLAAALMLAGGLIKHNLVAIPIAATVWLWLAGRAAFRAWIVAGVALAAAACAVLWAMWGATVFIDVLAAARIYSLARMTARGGPLILALLPALIACRPLSSAWRDDIRLALPPLLLAVAIPIGIVQRAGSGVNVNAFVEAITAVCIAVPVACARRPASRHAWAGIAALPILCLLPFAARQDIGELAGRDAAVRDQRPLIAALAAARGPVACDDQASCYWADRESAIDFFSVNQRLLSGAAAALEPALDRGDIAMIAMRGQNPGWQADLLIPAVHEHYRVIYQANGTELLTPKRQR